MQILTTLAYPFLKRFSPSLLVRSGLEDLGNGQWKVLTNHPQFELYSKRFYLLSGWVSIEVNLVSEERLAPKIYFDFGEGYSKARSIKLIQVDEYTYKADVMIPSPPKGIRFDPTKSLSTFSIEKIEFKLHSELFHTIHQFTSIAQYDYHNDNDMLRIFRKSYARYKKHGFAGMLERLDKEYNKLYPFRVRNVTSKHVKYMNWIRENESPHIEEFHEDFFTYTPLISIVMPTYNTSPEYLEKAIKSVLKQSYPNWELCIADDASSHKETVEILKAYMGKNPKIKVFFREENGHISLASNSALHLAKGAYVTFLDHDDMLAPNALLEVIKVINEKPEVKLLYTDEDKIDEKDRRYAPHFKSDWNPDMLMSQNYISHLLVIKKVLLDEVGVFREGYEGAQDYDLILRLSESLNENEIEHIDQILYHWRACANSTALNENKKVYTSEAGLNALKSHLSNKKYQTQVDKGMLPNTFKVSYPIEKEPLVSLIIPTRDGYDILSLCIQSILNNTCYQNYEIVIVDNQTTDLQTLAYFKSLTEKYSHIRILKYNKPFNFSAINNFAVSHVEGELVGLINNDVEIITSHWLKEMAEHALRPEIGAVGAKLYYDNDTIQHAGIILGIGGVAGHSHKYFTKDAHGYFSRLKIIQNLSAVTAAALIVKKSLYMEVGGLDEEHLKVAFNDVDFCLKLQAKGYRNLWTPYVELYHHESVSRGAEDTEEKKIRFEKEVHFMKKKWGNTLKRDRYYNRHLTLKDEKFGIHKTPL